ncbi:MAG: tetratricopeptide repeat protein [Vampirovibrionales bacterium]
MQKTTNQKLEFVLSISTILLTGVLAGVFFTLWQTPVGVYPDEHPYSKVQFNRTLVTQHTQSASDESDKYKDSALIALQTQGMPTLSNQSGSWNTVVSTSPKEPLVWFRTPSHQGIHEDTFVQGLTTFEALKQAAYYGNPQATYELALAYEDGALGLHRSPFQGLHWMKKAALRGHPQAMYEYAVRLQRRAFNSKDLLNSYVWLKFATEAGYTKAQTLLDLTWNMLEEEQRRQVPGVVANIKDDMLQLRMALEQRGVLPVTYVEKP